MTWTEERISINQHLQIGAEATTALGTSVSAAKELLCFEAVYQPKGDTVFYRGTGRKYPSEQEQNTEWMEATWGGVLDFNGIIYPAASVFGNVAPTSYANSATAKSWAFAPPITGSIVPRTYTVEQGDASYAQKSTYNLFTDLGYTITRKDVKMTAKTISQPIQTGITLTSTPTIVALSPIPAKYFSIYMDTTSAGLGTTKLTKVLQVQYTMPATYGPFWPINAANASFTNHLDLAPAATVKIFMEADSVGLARVADWEAGTTYFLRNQAIGLIIDNLQIGTITGGPTGGTFTLTYKGQTTAGIAYNATGATVQTAFRLLSTVPATTTVTGNAGGPYSIVFSPTDTLAQDTTAITASGAGFTGGSTPAIAIAASQTYATLTHDMAIKFGEPSQFQDKDGVFAIEWTGNIVEDATWGNAQLLTVLNLITAL